MSVYKHQGSPYWRFDFELGGYRFSGVTGVAKDRPKREAEEYEKTERRKADELVKAAREEQRAPLTLALACERWWNEVGQYTSETDLKDALAWLRDQIGGKRGLHTIRDDDVTKAVAERRKHQVKAGHDDNGKQLYRPISARTVNRTVVYLLRRIVLRARDKWSVVIFKMPEWSEHALKEKKRPIRELMIEEEDRLGEIDREDYLAVREFATITGLRLNEVLLTWTQVDFDNAVVRLVAKGDEPRIVPLSTRAYAILWAERKRHPEWVFTFVAKRTRKCPKTGQMYIKGQRYPITYWGLSTHRRRTFVKAGVNARWHDLRHTAGMRTVRATGSLKAAQRLLGHSDIATTSRFYVDALVDDVRDAMEATERHQAAKREEKAAREAGESPAKTAATAPRPNLNK
jgi:integrase